MKIKELIKREYDKRISNRRDVLQQDIAEKEKLLYDIESTLSKNVEQVYSIEKKYNGFRAVIHKKGTEVKIFSDQAKDITSPFPTAIKQALQLSDADYIIDAEMVPHDAEGNPLGRDVAAKYIGAVESKKSIDDSGIIFYAFDIIYYNKDLTDLPWHERRQILQKLKFTDNIKICPSVVVKTANEIKKAINLFSKMKGSEGAMIKLYSGKYSPGKETDDWVKYRVLLELHVLVSKVNAVEGSTAKNYHIGIKLSGSDVGLVKEDYILDYNDIKLLDLGNSFNTGIIANEGDALDILVEEVWRHKYKDGKIRYSLHKPNVKGKSKSQETSAINDLDAMVTSRGVEIIESEETMAEDVDVEQQPTDYPPRMQEALKSVMDKWMPFVMQWHYRGHEANGYEMNSLHADFRMDVGNHLEGITILSPTSTNESVADNVQAGKWNNVRCVLKLPQPRSWLSVDGIMQKGEPGTTTNAPAVYVIIAKGKYKPVIVEDHKIVVEIDSDAGEINQSIFEKAEKDNIKISRKPGDSLRNLPKKVSFHIAHIGNKHIILSDEVK